MGALRIGFMSGGKSALWRDEDLASKWVEKANAWMEENAGHPFFLYFAPNDIHVPRMPAERFQGNSRSDWFLALLEQFPTPASITALSKEAFVEAAWDLVGRKVAKARLLGDIYETAHSSMALPARPDSPDYVAARRLRPGMTRCGRCGQVVESAVP